LTTYRSPDSEWPGQALEQPRESVLRYGEVVGCELLTCALVPTTLPMIEKYLAFELAFLGLLVLSVAMPICRHRAPAQLQFLWSALGISLVVIVGNVGFQLLGI
jgi:hypothetical protein